MNTLIKIYVVLANLCMACWFINFMYELPMSGLNRLFQYGLLCFFFANTTSVLLGWLNKIRILRTFIITVSLGFITISCISAGFGLKEMINDHITWKNEQEELVQRLANKSLHNLTTTAINGSSWSFSNHVGKVILVDFWATWCGPCVQAMPEMKKIYDKYSSYEDFIMVGVSLDEDAEELLGYCTSNSILWTQLFEDDMVWSNSVAQVFEVDGIPSVGIVDRSGNIIAANLHGREIYRKLDEVLKTPNH